MAQRRVLKALRDEPIAEDAGLLHSIQSMQTCTETHVAQSSFGLIALILATKKHKQPSKQL